jgi:hypothetical protein
VLEPGEEALRRVLRVAAALAALVVAGSAQAADTPSTRLAAAMKRSIAATYGKSYVLTKVTCAIPSSTSTHASCNASFTRRSQQLEGVFHIAVTINRSTGGVTWRATSATCTDLVTGAKVRC